jgi:ribosome-binding protein aMBF1 (putative translation factor)
MINRLTCDRCKEDIDQSQSPVVAKLTSVMIRGSELYLCLNCIGDFDKFMRAYEQDNN